MNIQKLIENRRSVFPAQYNNEPVSTEEITQIVEAANWAPTHKKTEPWRFKILQKNKDDFGEFLAEGLTRTSEKKVSDFKKKKISSKFKSSAAVIVICMQRDPKERIPEWEEIASTAMAVQNMWLTAFKMDIGGYWSSPKKLIPLAKEYFELGNKEQCLGFFYLGKYDGELLEGERSSISEKVEWK